MTKGNKPVELAEGIFWVGSDTGHSGLDCNAYLLIDSGEGVLFDPGNVLDFDDVLVKVQSCIALDRITHIILHHQDADLCGSVPLFEKAGVAASLAVHWRTMLIVQYFGIRSPYYIVNEHDFELKLRSGRTLYFVPTPYLHFAGSIATYDPRSKILFSSDLFGAFRHSPELWADSSYIEAMKAYHEHYMPSNDLLRPVMERFLRMDISMIAPQHGSIIRENIKEKITVLRDLECGGYMMPVKKQLGLDGSYGSICGSVIRRYQALFSKEEVSAVFYGTALSFEAGEPDLKKWEAYGAAVWNMMFDIIADKKATAWLLPIEPFITKLTKEYGLLYPNVLLSLRRYSEKNIQRGSCEPDMAVTEAASLKEQFQETEKILVYDALSGLHNDIFFRSFLIKEIDSSREGGVFSVIFFSVDSLSRINNSLGKKTGDEILMHLSYLLKNFLASNADCSRMVPFKAEGPWFALFAPDTDIEKAAEVADRMRVAVAQSSVFITNITISAGIVCLDEFRNAGSAEKTAATIHDSGMMKGRIAQKKGPGSIYYKVDKDDFAALENFVLIADSDTMNLGILKKEFSDRGITAITCEDGAAVLAVFDQHEPQAVICELMLPKIDAFRIKEQLNLSLNRKGIPFILLAHEKNEKLVTQSLSLGITFFFKKPCLPAEIAGITGLLVSGT